MSNHGTVRLGDVATYINGYAFKPSDWSDNGLPIIRIQNLTGNDYQTNYYNKEYNPKYLVKKGDVLISWSASLGVFVWKKEDALLNQHIFKVVFDKIDVDKDYFCLAVEYLLKRMGSEVHGSTMKHITKPRFDNTLFPLPDKDTQKQISKKIITVDKLVHKYEVIAQKLDELIKSRFVEMFGDVERISHNWETKPFSDVTINHDNTRKPVKESERKKIQGSYPYYGATGIVDFVNDYLIDGTFLLVSEDGKALEIRNKNIAFIATGKIWVNNHAHVLQCTSYVNLFFLLYYMNYRDISSWVTGIDQKKLNRENLDSIPVGVPPIYLQNQFADFVTKVEQQKATVQKSIEKLETLKKSLMQEYFG